jgi:hypothetical protein
MNSILNCKVGCNKGPFCGSMFKGSEILRSEAQGVWDLLDQFYLFHWLNGLA